MSEYAFKIPPAAGYVHERYGQRYELVSAEPYKRKDGALSAVLVWRSTCACGAQFEVRAGLTTNGLIRRCLEHRAKRAAKAETAAPKAEPKKPAGRSVPYADGLQEANVMGGKVFGRYGIDGRTFKFIWSPDEPIVTALDSDVAHVRTIVPQLQNALGAAEPGLLD